MADIYQKHGLFELSDGVFKGKGISSLLESRDKKEKLIEMFGGKENLPSSIMRAKKKRVDETNDALVASRRYGDTGYINKDPQLQRAFETSMRGARGRSFNKAFGVSGQGTKAGALSTFPQNIGRSVLMLYSDPGQSVIDLYAGHNSRMELCVANGRHYEGYDISKEFMAFNQKRAKELLEFFPSAKIKLHLADSRDCKQTKAASADFTLTSPPYWDVEWYGDEPEQLGKSKTYDDFLVGIGKALKENYRILKPGSFAVWFINDFRRKGIFHLYHMDIARLGQEAGFTVHDLMVVDFGPGIRDAFYNETYRTKTLPKRHEFGIVFKKPEGRPVMRKR